MASSAESIAHAHIDFLEDTLRQMGQRHAGVHRALMEAEVALERAKHEVDALRLEDDTMRASCASLLADISARRETLERETRALAASRVRKILATFPAEVLQAIFLEATNLENELWPEDDSSWLVQEYDICDAATPFAIAAVNRQWRTLALRTADIWSCVTASGLGIDGSASLRRVKTMLSRSKNRELCLMMCWGSCSWAGSADYQRILDALSGHTRRWRRATLILPEDTPESALGFLHRPMGRLQDLYLSSEYSDIINWVAASKSLPLYPQLRRLSNNMLFSIPRHQLTALVYLHIVFSGDSPCAIWDVLRMAPSLVYLTVEIFEHSSDWSNALPTPVGLVKLKHLAFYGHWDPPATWLSMLQLPCLETLELEMASFDPLSAIFDAVAQTVTSLLIDELHVHAQLLAGDMNQVRKLHHLRTIIFRDCTFIGPDLALVFASRASAGLQHLEEVRIDEPKLDEEQAHRLADLVQAIHDAQTAGADERLSLVLEAEAEDVPEWLLEQYEFLTGDSGGSDDSATSHRSSTPSSSSVESEAVFTDGGSGDSSSGTSDSDSDSDWKESDVEEGG